MPVNWKATGGTLAAVVVLVFVLVYSRDTGPSAMSQEEIIAAQGGELAPAVLASNVTESEVSDPNPKPPPQLELGDPVGRLTTPEGRDYAQSVDCICAISFNQALEAKARLERVAYKKDLGVRETRAALARIGAAQNALIEIGLSRLPDPPERADLFAKFRAELARLIELRRPYVTAIERGNLAAANRFGARHERRVDHFRSVGLRLGLRVCTVGGDDEGSDPAPSGEET